MANNKQRKEDRKRIRKIFKDNENWVESLVAINSYEITTSIKDQYTPMFGQIKKLGLAKEYNKHINHVWDMIKEKHRIRVEEIREIIKNAQDHVEKMIADGCSYASILAYFLEVVRKQYKQYTSQINDPNVRPDYIKHLEYVEKITEEYKAIVGTGASSGPSTSNNGKSDSSRPTPSGLATSGRPPTPPSSPGSPGRDKKGKSPPRTPPTHRANEKKQRTTSPVPKNSPKSPKPAPVAVLALLPKPADANFFEGDYLVNFDKELLQWHAQQSGTLLSGQCYHFSSLLTYEDLFMTHCDMYNTTQRMVVGCGTHDQVLRLWINEPDWFSELLILSERDGRRAYVAQLVRLLEQIKWEVYHIRRDPINFQRFATLPGRPDRMSHRDRRLYVADLLIADFNIIARIAKDYADVDN